MDLAQRRVREHADCLSIVRFASLSLPTAPLTPLGPQTVSVYNMFVQVSALIGANRKATS